MALLLPPIAGRLPWGVTRGLTGRWPLDTASLGNTLGDLVGVNPMRYNASTANPIATDGPPLGHSRALQFGTGVQPQTAIWWNTSPIPDTGWFGTVSFWLYLDQYAAQAADGDPRIMAIGTTTQLIIVTGPSTGNFGFQYGTVGRLTGATSVPLSTWTHLAFTYDNSGADAGVKLYLNGVDVSTGSAAGDGANAGQYSFMGRTDATPATSNDRQPVGRAADLRFYNSTVLTDDEIAQLYWSAFTSEEVMPALFVAAASDLPAGFQFQQVPIFQNRALPQPSPSLNLNLFKNPIPNSQFDWSLPIRAPHITPDGSWPLNPNLFKNPVPNNQTEWPQSFRVPHITPDGSRPLNPNLFKNPLPNNQTDWSITRRLWDFLPDVSVPLNLNLFKNPLPNNQTDWSKPVRQLPLPAPIQAYNSALYTVVVVAAPFNQTDWAVPQRLKALPLPPDALNINIFTNPIPFANLDRTIPLALRGPPDQTQPYNLNLYGVVTVSVPFNQTDWSRPVRPLPAPQPATSYNLNLFTNPLPFAQFEYPLQRRVPAAPTDLSRALNQNLFANPIPFAQFDWTPARKPLPRLGEDPPNFGILVAVAPSAPLEEHSLPFFATPGRLMGL